MAKPKATTLQQRFGFMDDDLKTKDHDDIMKWLDCNSMDIVKTIMNIDTTWGSSHVESLREKCNQASMNSIGRNFELGNPERKPEIGINKVWERAISGNNKFIIGFIDMEVSVFDWSLYVENVEEPYGKLRLRSNGYPAVFSIPKWSMYRQEVGKVLFEVKREIPSLGELIRQIRMYQEFVSSPFWVVSNDDRHTSKLIDQGIGFVKYPECEVSGKVKRV